MLFLLLRRTSAPCIFEEPHSMQVEIHSQIHRYLAHLARSTSLRESTYQSHICENPGRNIAQIESSPPPLTLTPRLPLLPSDLAPQQLHVLEVPLSLSLLWLGFVRVCARSTHRTFPWFLGFLKTTSSGSKMPHLHSATHKPWILYFTYLGVVFLIMCLMYLIFPGSIYY